MSALLPRFAFAAVSVLAGAVAAHAAAALTDSQKRDAAHFAADASLFVLYHEVAHLLVDQLGLPVLGKEEDAADNMATYMLLQQHNQAADDVLVDAAYGWLLSANERGDAYQSSDYYDMHSLDHQRAYQIVCLMVGNDPEGFRPVADSYGIDTDRQGLCADDYATMERSMNAVIGSARGKNNRGTDVAVVYEPAAPDMKETARAFRESGIFEQAANAVRTRYGLPHQVRFRATSCDVPNAYYTHEDVEIMYCYELFADFIRLISNDMPEVAEKDTGLGREGNAASP